MDKEDLVSLGELEEKEADELGEDLPKKAKKGKGRKSTIQIDFPDTVEECLAMLSQEKNPKLKIRIRGHLRKKHEYYISKVKKEAAEKSEEKSKEKKE